MRRFTELFHEVDRTTRTSEKTAALRRYFEGAAPADAAWALAVLTGRRLVRAVPYPRLRAWAGEVSGLPDWLIEECHSSVGDWSETLTLVVPPATRPADEPLHHVVEQRLLPIGQMDEAQQRRAVLDAWDTFDGPARFVFHKLVSGNFRFGAARKVVINALAAAAGVDPAVMQHRLAGRFQPSADNFRSLLAGDGRDDARPYPFYLASPLDDGPEVLGDPAPWRAEWKWDGIRVQLLRRGGKTIVWSRGDEVITDAFPELRALGDLLPEGTVIDGELLAFDAADRRPLPFSALQRRLNRTHMPAMLFADVPVVLMAYDLLEHDGQDVRQRSTDERRTLLEPVLPDDPAARLSRRIAFDSWEALATQREQSRERGVEGVMLKRGDAPYRTGRTRGAWWKWKVAPHTVDCVMVYAQRGSGRRSTLYTDYTFAVWDGQQRGTGQLVPVTKAYSGLTDAEFAQVDRFIRDHSTGKRGAFRQVEPRLVFEIAFEGIQRSDRHKSGVALRFPRMHRFRRDKPPEEADTLGSLVTLLESVEKGR